MVNTISVILIEFIIKSLCCQDYFWNNIDTSMNTNRLPYKGTVLPEVPVY